MDITYLLWLQGLREKAGPVVESFFSFITDLPFFSFTIILLCTIYWSVNTRIGFFILFSQSAGNFITNIIKNIACIYRPWIRDARIKPPLDAKSGATGYSFPSGHSQNVMSQYGSLAYSLFYEDKKNKNHKWRWAIIVCAVLILIVGFSRNFLTVHTPQDVAVGLCLGAALIWLGDKLLLWEAKGNQDPDKKNNRDLWITLGGTIFIIAVSIFVKFKPYPLDYVDGELLVDPYKMQSDYFTAAASFAALLWGWFIEKRWINFATDCSIKNRILRVVFGSIGLGIIYVGFSSVIKPFIPSYHLYCILKHFVLYFYVIGLYPLIFTAIERKIKK